MIKNSKPILCMPKMKNNFHRPLSKLTSCMFILLSHWAFLLSGICFSLDASTASSPHAFPVSESALRDLAKKLAPKVDLFRAVWEKDPEAEFFAGTTRDYLYWILGHFKGLENSDPSTNGTKQSDARREQIEAIKQKLLSLHFIKFNEIVGPESDADIMTSHEDELDSLHAEDFAIRKLDFISFDRGTPGHPMYQDEIDQGYIPSEKIRLSKKGIVTDSNFGNGVSDLISGNLSIQFPDIKKFWKTHYSKEGSNHPLLLALRYVRILAQDYLQRHGSEIPDARKLEAPMTKEIKLHIQKLIQDAITDANGSFRKLLQNKQGKKWLNSSIQKSFRSFTNSNAAFELMKELGLLGLMEVYPDQIESVHQYLLKTKRNESEIAKNFKKFRIKPDDLYEKLENYLPDLELYHGTESELAFRNIIYQGVIPSKSGAAGRGLYGVSKKDLEFAKEWSKGNSEQDDLVIALKLKSNTKIVDITKGKGKELFDKWMTDQEKDQSSRRQKNAYRKSERAISVDDTFAHAFGIDLLRYPYGSTEAFVLKNSEVIAKQRGVFKNPKPIRELISEAGEASKSMDIRFLKYLLETPLTLDERTKILSIPDRRYFDFILSMDGFRELRKIFKFEIIPTMRALSQCILHSHESLLWDRISDLMQDSDPEIRRHSGEILETLAIWPQKIWDQIPDLILQMNPDPVLRALKVQKLWPKEFLDKVPGFLRTKSNLTLKSHLTIQLQAHQNWSAEIWNMAPSLLRDDERGIRFQMASGIQIQKTWPRWFWSHIPRLLKNSNSEMRSLSIALLGSRNVWPKEFWDMVPKLLMDPDFWPHSRDSMASSLEAQRAWPQEVINAVKRSDLFEHKDLKKLKRNVLDFSKCNDDLSELND